MAIWCVFNHSNALYFVNIILVLEQTIYFWVDLKSLTFFELNKLNSIIISFEFGTANHTVSLCWWIRLIFGLIRLSSIWYFEYNGCWYSSKQNAYYIQSICLWHCNASIYSIEWNYLNAFYEFCIGPRLCWIQNTFEIDDWKSLLFWIYQRKTGDGKCIA